MKRVKKLAMAMVVPLILLTIIASFGIGFILNMMTKFWMSSGIAFLLLFVWILIKGTELSPLVWSLIGLMALGAFASAFTIRTLRNRGFRMFQ